MSVLSIKAILTGFEMFLFFIYFRGELDKHVVKNLIRSSSLKKAKDSSREPKRAISFRTQKSGEQLNLPPPDLQKAYVFRQGEGVVTPPPTPGQETPNENENAPDLPSAPPPQMIESKSPLSKKDKLSPPVSPKHKHHETAKATDDKKKRTPSFNIKKRTQSFKDKHRLPENLPPVEMEGLLERKQELQSGGKKATFRSWRGYYAALFGQLLCFFKDREGRLQVFSYFLQLEFIGKGIVICILEDLT